MKIYQIHECGGEWEDRFDFIVGSYLSKDRAMEDMELFIKEEADYQKCNSCPLYTSDNDCHNYQMDAVRSYCSTYEPFDESKHNCDGYSGNELCVNYKPVYYSSIFYIKEIHVIE